MNPRIGSGLQRPQGRGGTNRRGGEKPRGRHADGNRHSHLERAPGDATSRKATSAHGTPGRGLFGLDDGGAIFGQPHERKPGEQPGRKDRNASGKSAPRSGGSRVHGQSFLCADRSKVLEGHGAATRPKVEEGSSERPGSRDFDRILPPAGGTCRCGRVARTTLRRSLRRAASPSEGDRSCSASRSPAAREKSRTERSSRP